LITLSTAKSTNFEASHYAVFCGLFFFQWDENITYMESEYFIAVTMKSDLLWVVTPCSLENIYQHCGGISAPSRVEEGTRIP
jgi:hypothetical protein